MASPFSLPAMGNAPWLHQGYLVPVVGKLLACGDVILQGEERRFNPLGELQEYTLKVQGTRGITGYHWGGEELILEQS